MKCCLFTSQTIGDSSQISMLGRHKENSLFERADIIYKLITEL